MPAQPRCSLAGLELRDGGTAHSPLMGTFCEDPRQTQETSDNVLYIRWPAGSVVKPTQVLHWCCLTKQWVPCHGEGWSVRGNSAHQQAGLGGGELPGLPGQLQVDRGGTNSPRSNVDCEWRITGPTGHFLSFTFQQVRPAPSKSLCSSWTCPTT